MKEPAIFNTQYQVEKARALRKKGTEAEKLLWEELRNRKINRMKFRRQHPLGNFIVDFCSPEKRLVIEIDGSIHDVEENKEYDTIRQEELEKMGYTLIRFRNSDVINDLTNVLSRIREIAIVLPSPF